MNFKELLYQFYTETDFGEEHFLPWFDRVYPHGSYIKIGSVIITKNHNDDHMNLYCMRHTDVDLHGNENLSAGPTSSWSSRISAVCKKEILITDPKMLSKLKQYIMGHAHCSSLASILPPPP